MKKQTLFGLHTVMAALKNPQRKHKNLYLTEKSQSVVRGVLESLPPIHIVSLKELDQKVPPQSVHQHIVLETTCLEQPSLEEVCLTAPSNALIIILDQVTDPHNVGAILRSCAAFQVTALLVTSDHGADRDNVILAKVASGALEHVPLITVNNIAQSLGHLKSCGFWCYGLDEEGEGVLGNNILSGKIAFVFGAEGRGLRRLTKERCDGLLRIETNPLFPTLNISNALAIALFAQRKNAFS